MNSSSPRTNRVHFILSALAVVGSLSMLVFYLQRNGFWIDELYTLHSIRLGWKEMVFERLHRGHFPGYFALVRLWYSLWPERLFELSLRSMSVIFYLLAIASFWPLARRALGTPIALVALALFACNEIALRQASEARMYTVVLLIAVWMTRAWYEIQQPEHHTKWNILLVVLSVLGFAVSATVGIFLASMLAVALYDKPRNARTIKTLALSLLLGFVVFIPGVISHISTGDRIGVAAIKPMVFLAHPVALMPGVQIWDDYYQETQLLTALLIIGIPITLFAIFTLWKKRKSLSPELRHMAVIVALPLLFITACYPLIELFDLSLMGPPRYYLALLPMAAILGAWALMQVRRPVLLHATLTVFLLTSAWTILTIRVEPFRQQILENLKSDYRPGDGLVVTPAEIADGVELYLPGAKVDVAISRMEHDPAAVRQKLEPLSSRSKVFVVWYRGKHSPVPEVAKELWTKVDNKKMKDFSGVRVYSFTPEADTPPGAPL